ncbi:sialin-like [Sycon ciliatum]|uniref:sialin-like n=1 Tax=Sycon ciliatum TaxID=27933 RepID=UPI0031F6C6FC|eukprot:scpid48670/ scgid34079/ Sialin; Membrane glycoprotein HP59; Sodium/sialic acid cotransporter; Solute carrier family 17 member 5
MKRRSDQADHGLISYSSSNSLSEDGCCSCMPYMPARYMLAILSFLGFANVYALRVNLSVAIVAMVQSPDAPDAEFAWDKQTQGIILGSFFYGYILTQVPGGWLAGRIGGKKVFGFGVMITTVLTLLTPVAARAGVWWLVAVRIVEGIGEGVTFPAMHAIWGRWAPPLERSRLATITYAGPHFGTVISMPLSGLLAKYGFGSVKDYVGSNWPSVFYVFGAAGLIWCVAWFALAADSPSSHKRISTEEKNYIQTSIASSQSDQSHVPVPWSALLRSSAQWAIVVAHFCNNWGFYTLLTCLPTYMSDVLHFKIVGGSLYSALPYGIFGILIPLLGRLADYLRENHLSTTAVRKIFTTAGLCLPAIFLVITGFSETKSAALVFLTIGVASASPALSGFNINHLDLSPRFAGVLMGISNMFATIPGIVGPLVADGMTPDRTAHQWRNVFVVSAEIYLFGAFFYLVFASGAPQWWAEGVAAAPSDTVIQGRKKQSHKKKNSLGQPWGRQDGVTPLLYPTTDEDDHGGCGDGDDTFPGDGSGDSDAERGYTDTTQSTALVNSR